MDCVLGVNTSCSPTAFAFIKPRYLSMLMVVVVYDGGRTSSSPRRIIYLESEPLLSHYPLHNLRWMACSAQLLVVFGRHTQLCGGGGGGSRVPAMESRGHRTSCLRWRGNRRATVLLFLKQGENTSKDHYSPPTSSPRFHHSFTVLTTN